MKALAALLAVSALGFVFASNRAAPQTPEQLGTSRAKQLLMASQMYANDFDDQFPLKDWGETIQPYAKSADSFRSPGAPGYGKPDVYGYAFSNLMLGKVFTALDAPALDPQIFDSVKLQKSAVAEFKTLPFPGRYVRARKRWDVVGYADGHVKALSPKRGAATPEHAAK